MAKKHRFARTIENERAGAITPAEYSGLQAALDFFNKTLFAGRLPDNVFIVYTRKARSAGHFAANRYVGRACELVCSEISLNPDLFPNQTDKQICQTLVHEMVHLERETLGTAPSRGYHDRQFAELMKRVGLQPSSTGAVGGKETGQHMSDYPIPDGAFERAYEELQATGWRLNLESAHQPGPRAGPNSKTKFSCKCGQNAWGRPDLKISCTPCEIPMRPAEAS